MPTPTELPVIILGKALAKSRGLSHLRLSQIFKQYAQVLELPAADREISAGAAMVLWTAELLNRTPFSVDQQNAVLNELGGQLYSLGCSCKSHMRVGERPNAFQLAFTDGRYFTYTGSSDFLDLETGGRAKPSLRPLESLAYDLVELYARRYREAALE